MNYDWQYPIYVIPHHVGLVSLVEPRSDGEPAQLLAVYTNNIAAQEFMNRFEVQGSPRKLNNDREFGWLLKSLHDPVNEVAFDPKPTDDEINPEWRVSVRDLLKQHLKADNSPWNYPIFVIARDHGFVCIDGKSSGGQSLKALGIFSSLELAKSYLDGAGESGTPCELADMDQARTFLTSLADDVAAVALNPVVADDRRSAKHCIDLETLLAKYLVLDGEGTQFDDA